MLLISREEELSNRPPQMIQLQIKLHDDITKKRHLQWLYTFMLLTFAFQIALVPEVLFPIRTWLRAALFGISLVMLVLPYGTSTSLPITNYGALILGIMLMGLLNPNSNGLLASVASIILNLSIIAPIFWLGRMKIDSQGLKGILLMLWAFHALSVVFGVLEVMLPARFSRESTISMNLIGEIAEGLKIVLADGTKIYRPMGLSDSPGGACQSGFLVILLGSFFISSKYSLWVRVLFACSIVFGFFCIYLSQVRSAFILVVICEFALVALMMARGDTLKVAGILTLMGALLLIATVWAFTIGGEQVSNRITTLWETDAGTVYYSNRGFFLEDTVFNLIPEYPFGAGLGRWGMVNQYFGDKSSQGSSTLWAEIQSTAWIYDGGIPLLCAYYGAIAYCLIFAYRTAINRRDLCGEFGVLVFAHNLAILALTFSYVPFIGQSGLYFWILNAGLMTVVYRNDSQVVISPR